MTTLTNDDTLYTEALSIVSKGYNRALKIIERMRKEQVVNANNVYQCW
jgi:hypothetical protein